MSDTHSVDAIVRAVYECISGPAGEERDWSRFSALFLPGARLTRVFAGPDGTPQSKMMSVREYQEDTSEYFLKNPFYEVEVARHAEEFGRIAQIFSTYESRHHPEDVLPFNRGINSIQLFHNGARWWIVSVLWESKRECVPNP